jgi:hypothetical protein
VAAWGRKIPDLLAELGEGARRGKKAAGGWSRCRPVGEEMASGGGGGSGGDRDGVRLEEGGRPDSLGGGVKEVAAERWRPGGGAARVLVLERVVRSRRRSGPCGRLE